MTMTWNQCSEHTKKKHEKTPTWFQLNLRWNFNCTLWTPLIHQCLKNEYSKWITHSSNAAASFYLYACGSVGMVHNRQKIKIDECRLRFNYWCGYMCAAANKKSISRMWPKKRAIKLQYRTKKIYIFENRELANTMHRIIFQCAYTFPSQLFIRSHNAYLYVYKYTHYARWKIPYWNEYKLE